MSTQNDAFIQQDFARLKERLLALSYGKHSSCETLPQLEWYYPRHQMKPMTQLGDLENVVYYSNAVRGFTRANNLEKI